MTADSLPPAHAAMADIDRPLPSPNPTLWGSDPIAAVLRDLGLPYIALNPGASFRGLHDSLVNYLGNRQPQMLLCLHEENAVAIAHGYAKMSGRPMAAAVHSNVGLMHASMAVFDAFCDRVPLILLGATGTFDAVKRRPWIEWIHTAQDQGALIRNFVKYDDQPHSPAAARESILRALQIATTPPMGPVYINLDVTIQEMRLDAPLPPLDVSRYRAPPSVQPDPALIGAMAKALAAARAPLILMGRVATTESAWRDRIALAEKLGARVLTDLKAAAAFPTDHPLHAAPPGMFPHPQALEAVKGADAILSLDWIDLAGLLRTAFGGDAIPAKVLQCSLDQHIHNGWSKDHQGLPPMDHFCLTEPDVAVRALLSALKGHAAPARASAPIAIPALDLSGPTIDVAMIPHALRRAAGNRKVTILRTPLSWGGQHWHFTAPDSYLGFDGGAGIGSGPGMVVGAAMALRDSGKSNLPVAVLGDGDFLMSVTALWTAAHYKIPVLILVANNRSFFNDEIHQERVAIARTRPVENRWIGQRIGEPEIDIAGMARAQGCTGIGPVANPARLADAIAQGIAAVEAGETVVVDVRVAAGYDPSTVAALRSAKS